MEPVERDVTLPVEVEEAWRLLTEPAELATWLGAEVDLVAEPGASGEVVDHDGTRRHVRVESVDPGRGITWYWWSDTDDDAVSKVELVLNPDAAGTHLSVIERPLLPSARAGASASFRAGMWSHRLFALEVRCLALSTAVLVTA